MPKPQKNTGVSDPIPPPVTAEAASTASPQAQSNNKHGGGSPVVGPHPDGLHGYARWWGDACQRLPGRGDGGLTSKRLRETPFTSFPMSEGRLPTRRIRCRRREMQIRGLFLPSAPHDYHATVLAAAPRWRCRCIYRTVKNNNTKKNCRGRLLSD